ncbi:Uncharacterised protein [Vibrio cholerae]|uniref:Uncharacterized protein n=1 Tax=Vibrio cholerae TaxID=666 RepID=A0A655R9L3_VIBCL|nr:Uncharacterised protein [Vibrio cholerae]CSA89507.1 Uncharacterised protein [Vibrio cholerae]CSD39447.1 Uncharacterised protein [Vibrio cholerae]CSI33940.1 Uncharacterised protein [Vibrio cholerae]
MRPLNITDDDQRIIASFTEETLMNLLNLLCRDLSNLLWSTNSVGTCFDKALVGHRTEESANRGIKVRTTILSKFGFH